MKKAFVIYYLFMLLVLFTWTGQVLPPMSLRLIYLCLIAIPIILYKAALFPLILSTFVLISSNRYATSYMPFLPQYLLVVSLIALILGVKKPRIKLIAPCVILLLIAIHTSLVDFIASKQIPSLALSSLVCFSFFFFIQGDAHQRSKELALSFVVIAFVLSLEMVIFGSRFTYSITVGVDDYERIGWNDPNYFSALIGAGVFSAIHLLVSKQFKARSIVFFLYLTVALSVYVLLIVASRGALIALLIAVIPLAFFSKRKGLRYFSLLCVILLIVYWIGGFDFLLARFENDEGEIGGRSIIWSEKIKAFVANGSIEKWIVGYGKKDGYELAFTLGNTRMIGFHNDFLSFFVCYGILGLLYLILLFIVPIIRYKSLSVTTGILYIMVICLSLEPMSGLLDFYYFYFFLITLGEGEKQLACA